KCAAQTGLRDVLELTATDEHISFTWSTMLQGCHQPGHVVFDVQPITSVGAGAIKRDQRVRECVANHGRNEFFSMLARPVIIAAICNDGRKSIRPMPRPHKVVGGGLAGGIRRIRSVAAAPTKIPVFSKRTEDLVRRDVHKSESSLPSAVQPRPLVQR